MLDQGEELGDNSIPVEVKVPSAGRNSSGNATGIAQGIQVTTLTLDDADAVAQLPNVSGHTYAGIIGQALASREETNKQVFLLGGDGRCAADRQEYRAYREEFLFGGRRSWYCADGGARRRSEKTFFGESPAVGQSITIKGSATVCPALLRNAARRGLSISMISRIFRFVPYRRKFSASTT